MCSLDGARFTPCPSPDRLPRVSFAQHTFRVTAIDPAGNGDASPAVGELPDHSLTGGTVAQP